MIHKEFIKKLTKLKKGDNLILGDYQFYRDDKFYVYNSHKNIIESEYRLDEMLLLINDYRGIAKRFEEKALTGREKTYFQCRFAKE